MITFPNSKSGSLRVALAALAVAGVFLTNEGLAAAEDCDIFAWPPICGALQNHTADTRVRVRWWHDGNGEWVYAYVEPDTTMGGYLNDGIDVDYWFIPEGCTDHGGIGGTNMTWSRAQYPDGWAKINSDQTVVIDRRSCPQPPPVPPPPPPTQVCVGPSSWPTTKSWINIFTTAIGRAGTSNGCSIVGRSYTGSNPQYVWCRRWGGEVRDSQGNFNHWWLWTDLDTGGRGWISAYYIQGQGDDQANDKNTGRPIPPCQ
jgi:hypothetical protein